MNRTLKLLLGLSAIWTLSVEALAPVYAVFVEHIGGDLLTAGGAYSIFAIVTGVTLFIMGKWEDRFKHLEKLVVIGACIKAIGFAGYVFVSRPIHLFLVQIILGLGEAITSPAYDSLYSKSLDKRRAASEWGTWESLRYIAAAVAALIGGFVAKYFGFQMLFYFMILLSLANVFLSLRLISTKKTARNL